MRLCAKASPLFCYPLFVQKHKETGFISQHKQPYQHHLCNRISNHISNHTSTSISNTCISNCTCKKINNSISNGIRNNISNNISNSINSISKFISRYCTIFKWFFFRNLDCWPLLAIPLSGYFRVFTTLSFVFLL